MGVFDRVHGEAVEADFGALLAEDAAQPGVQVLAVAGTAEVDLEHRVLHALTVVFQQLGDAGTLAVVFDVVADAGLELAALDQGQGLTLDEVAKGFHQVGGEAGVAAVALVIEALPGQQAGAAQDGVGALVEQGVAE